MNVLALPRYGRQGASSRVRFLQYLPALAAAGIDCSVSPLFDDELLLRKYRLGGYAAHDLIASYLRRTMAMVCAHRFDLLWIEKEALPWLPVWAERLLLQGKPYVLDFDDAIFHNYDLHRFRLARRLFGRRIDSFMATAKLVIAGNRYLARRAENAGAKHISILPTVVDSTQYIPKSDYRYTSKPRLVWIGSPSSVQYLLELAETLRMIHRRSPFRLRIVGGGEVKIAGVDIEIVPWSSDTEAAAIAECDIGIMPLPDTPWERGKCAYKLIQYMACGLPTIASPVGANCDVIVDGKTGFLVDTPTEWLKRTQMLVCDEELRESLGKAGRARVQTRYCLRETAPELVQLLKQAAVSGELHRKHLGVDGGPR